LRPGTTILKIKNPISLFITGSGVELTAKTKSKNLILINFFADDVKE